MALCIKCKQAIPDGSAFCNHCGKKQAPEPRKHKKRANGTGNITKLSGNRQKPWLARKNGVCVGTYKTRTEAQKALERMTDMPVNDKFNMTFSQVYERWKKEHSRTISEKMVKNYDLSYRQCAALHNMQIRKIMRSDYQAAIIALEIKGKSKSTCNKARVLLGMLGRWAMEEGITLNNPAEGLTTVAKQLTERKTFTDDQITAIKGATHHAADIALILISCGCRPGELFAVPLADCYDDHFIGGSKTEAGKNRVIPIGPDGLDAYRRLREKATNDGKTLLIDGYSGKNKTSDNFAKRDWKELMQECGIEGMTPYNCRHTFITRSIRAGMELPVLEAIVGHVDRETTRIYTHLQAGDLVKAVARAQSSKETQTVTE